MRGLSLPRGEPAGVEVAASQLRLRRGSRRRSVDLDAGVVHAGEVVDAAGVAHAAALLTERSRLRASAALCSPRFAVRFGEVSAVPRREVPAAAVRLCDEVERLVDDPVSAVVPLRGSADDGWWVAAFAAPDALVDGVVSALSLGGVRVSAVEVGAVAAARTMLAAGHTDATLVDVGATSVTVTSVRDGVPVLARTEEGGVTGRSAVEVADQVARTVAFVADPGTVLVAGAARGEGEVAAAVDAEVGPVVACEERWPVAHGAALRGQR